MNNATQYSRFGLQSVRKGECLQGVQNEYNEFDITMASSYGHEHRACWKQLWEQFDAIQALQDLEEQTKYFYC